MVVWQKMFADPIPWDDIGSSVINLGLYTVGTGFGAWFIFVRKDILS